MHRHGAWRDSRADFAAGQVRNHLAAQWEGLAEIRWPGVPDGGDRRGWPLGADRQIGENFKIGVSFNFTDVSDNLTDLAYDRRGWVPNLAGYY